MLTEREIINQYYFRNYKKRQKRTLNKLEQFKKGLASYKKYCQEDIDKGQLGGLHCQLFYVQRLIHFINKFIREQPDSRIRRVFEKVNVYFLSNYSKFVFDWANNQIPLGVETEEGKAIKERYRTALRDCLDFFNLVDTAVNHFDYPDIDDWFFLLRDDYKRCLDNEWVLR